MRYELEEEDDYALVNELLTQRCVAWARGQGRSVDADIVGAVLDSRHTSTDGRLNHWTDAAVRRAVLEWIPRELDIDRPGARRVGDSVRALVGYLAEHGLYDPRGAALDEVYAAIAAAEADYPAAVAAAAQPTELDVLARWAGVDDERMLSQLPIVLPDEAELARAAAESAIVDQLRRLVDWVGPRGRKLTARGFLRIADARELVAVLETGDAVDDVRSSADLPRLGLLLGWAKRARLVRVVNGELRAVAKARALLADPLALWSRLFDAYFELGDDLFSARSWFSAMFEDVAIDVLNTLYSLPYPMPVLRLELPVWLTWLDRYYPFGGAEEVEFMRAACDAALGRSLETLAELGAVELGIGVAHPDFSIDLADDFDDPFGGVPLEPAELQALREGLRAPGRQVRLTDLGTAAMRRRMLAQGREAGLVGELVDVEPAALLGTLADHYPDELARLELEGWLTRHDNDLDALLMAVQRCPFRARGAAMLRMLAVGVPQQPDLLTRLRTHPQLAPLAIMVAVELGQLEQADLGLAEGMLAMTESMLMLWEMGGPEQVRAQVAGLPVVERKELAAAVRESGHPASAEVAELAAVLSDKPIRRLRPV